MSNAVVLDALALPDDVMVGQRIPKKMLVELGAPTAADKRLIQDGIEELQWVAALKPTNIGVPVFRDTEREYLEVAILTVTYRHNAKVVRLTELIHRAIPYPVLLVSSFLSDDVESVAVSAAHKRFAHNDGGKHVVDEILETMPISSNTIQSPTIREFLGNLAVSKQAKSDIFSFYQGWLDSIVGLMAAGITGNFYLPESREKAVGIRQNIARYSQIFDEINALRMKASKEKQINRLVELNIKIKGLESMLAESKTVLNQTNLKTVQ